MRDEIDGRMWVEHHDAFSRSIAELFAAIKPGLARLHAIEWDAPWRGRRPGQA